MIILALDVTSEHGSIAIRRDGQTVLEQSISSPDGYSHLIFQAIDELLQRVAVRLSQIDCFAAASGPGAFTGVRVGLAAVKGLAEAMGKKALGISNLRALAVFGTSPLRTVILDARRGDVFTAVYDAELRAVVREAVGKLQVFFEGCPNSPGELITQAPDWLQTTLNNTPYASLPITQAPRHLASAIAWCAERDLAEQATGDPAALDANYIRYADAELFWKDS